MTPQLSWTSDPAMYDWYVKTMAQQHPNQTPMAFDVDLSRLSPEEQNKFLAAQGKKLWRDAVNKQQNTPGKGGSQPLPQGGLAVSTPGIPGADDPYWIQQARRARFDYNRGLDRKYREQGHGKRARTMPTGDGNYRWNPTTKTWEEDTVGPGFPPPGPQHLQPESASALSAPSALEMASNAPFEMASANPFRDEDVFGPGGNYQAQDYQRHGPRNDVIARRARDQQYAGYGPNEFGPMRYTAAAHDMGQDPTGRMYAPGYLMNAARQAQQPGGPVPRGMDWLRNAPIMTMGGPQAQSIRDWYMRASAMQGDPGAYVPPV